MGRATGATLGQGHRVTVSIAVVGHHTRRNQAEDLAAHLGAHLLLDDGTHGLIPNHRRAWEWAAAQDATHALVLQDDALPCTDFLYHLHNAVDHTPTPGLVSLYTGTDKRPTTKRMGKLTTQAIQNGRAWITTHRLLHGVAILAPTTWAPHIANALTDPHLPYDDTLNMWARDNAVPTHYTAGSLIDHHPGPSTLGHDHRGNRRAHKPGPPATWNTQAVTL